MKQCKNCGKVLTKNQSQNTYCSQHCALESQKDKKIQDWLSGKTSGNYNGISGANQLSKIVRDYLLKESNYSCEICGWNKINPITKKCPLEIHHIDGNYMNNSKDNLQVLCPNCHSLTENYKALNKNSNRTRTAARKTYCKDCGKEISTDAIRCKICNSKFRAIDKPLTREELKEKIRVFSFVKIAEEQGVTDNAIRKWCIKYNLPSKKKDILKYTDEEWQKI